MEDHQKIRSQFDSVEQRLASSSMIRLFISATVLAVAGLVAVINYNLVAVPMSEMVGIHSEIGRFRISEVAAFLIVSLQVVLGIFIMDALRVTRYFSLIGNLQENKRRTILGISCFFLLMLVAIQVLLALLWDRTTVQMVELQQTLSGENGEVVVSVKIAMIGQMIMGIVLPLILIFVAIPLESFITSFRTAIGFFAAWALRLLAFMLRLFGNLTMHAGRMVTHLYDLAIFPALWLERNFLRRGNQEQNTYEARPNVEETAS